MNKLDCNIVRDLLPSYVEKLTSEQSNEAVTEHIKECSSCSQYLDELKQSIGCNKAAPGEIDYLKKVRRRMKKSSYISIGILSLVAAALLSLILYFYVIGWPVDMYSAYPSIEYDYVKDTVILSGQLRNGNRASRVSVRKDNKTNKTKVTVYETLSSFISNNSKYSVTIPMQDDLFLVCQEKEKQHELLFEYLPSLTVIENGNEVKSGQINDRTVYGRLIELFSQATDTGITVKHDEPNVDSYTRLRLPKLNHKFIFFNEESIFIPYEDEIFIYEKDGRYVIQQYDKPLKELTDEKRKELQGYLDTAVYYWQR